MKWNAFRPKSTFACHHLWSIFKLAVDNEASTGVSVMKQPYPLSLPRSLSENPGIVLWAIDVVGSFSAIYVKTNDELISCQTKATPGNTKENAGWRNSVNGSDVCRGGLHCCITPQAITIQKYRPHKISLGKHAKTWKRNFRAIKPASTTGWTFQIIIVFIQKQLKITAFSTSKMT